MATFNQLPNVDPEKYDQFREWMGSQPGILAGYHAHDPATGKHRSISVWESREAVMAMKDRVFPGGPLGLKPDAVELLEVDSTFGPGSPATGGVTPPKMG